MDTNRLNTTRYARAKEFVMKGTLKSLWAAIMLAALQAASSQALAVEQPAVEIAAGNSLSHHSPQGGDYGV